MDGRQGGRQVDCETKWFNRKSESEEINEEGESARRGQCCETQCQVQRGRGAVVEGLSTAMRRSPASLGMALLQRLGALGVLSVLVAVPAAATSVIAKSFVAMCSEADEIFAATVSDVRSYRRDDGRIWTAVRFEDLRWVAGGDSVDKELHFAGGKLGDRAEVVGGMPRFEIGQRVVLFVRATAAMSPIVGFHQGCFGIRQANGEDVIVTVGGNPVLAADTAGVRTGRPGDIREAMSLDDFVEVVKSIRAAGAAP